MTTQPVDAPHDDTPDDDDEAADLVAELDDTQLDDDDDGAGAPDNGDPDRDFVSGVCRGGPYDGHTVAVGFASGFLLADRERGRAWVYDHDGQAGGFVCRDAAGAPLDDERRRQAADGDTYDVVAYDDDPDARAQVHS